MKHRIIYTIIIFFFIYILTIGTSISQANEQYKELLKRNFEDVVKTLYLIDICFQENDDKSLSHVAHLDFINSSWYKTFKEYCKSSLINFNYSTELCIKEFIINKNVNHVLNILFCKIKDTNMWYIKDANIKKNNIIKHIEKKGFSPLAFSRNFEDLIQKIQSGLIDNYLGLAQYGKLNRKFFKKNKLFPSSNSIISYQNIIIHSEGVIKDIIYLKFKYFPIGTKENNKFKGGWLLIQGGSMKEIYKKEFEDNIFIQHLLGNFLPKHSELNKPNENIIYINLQGKE